MRACFFLFFCFVVAAHGTRSVIAVHNDSRTLLKSLEVDWWQPRLGHVLVNEATLAQLRAAEYHYEVLIPDVDKVIVSQAEARAEVKSSNWDATYHPYADIMARLQSLAVVYDLSLETVGNTIQGRNITAVRFGGSAKNNAVYIQCGIHAREWISPASCMYVIEHLLAAREAGLPEVVHLLSSLELIFIPVLNADGYVNSWDKDRLWRKNMRPMGGGTGPTDLNRNWDDHWGGAGSSGRVSDETYRGTKPFSEPETTAVVDFLSQLTASGVQIEAAIDIHSYGQLILSPYGWTTPDLAVPGNDKELVALGRQMRDAISATTGAAYTPEHAAELYVACGGAEDWLASNMALQMNAFTIELRDTGTYGFLLPDSQIVPTGSELLAAILVDLGHVVSKIAN